MGNLTAIRLGKIETQVKIFPPWVFFFIYMTVATLVFHNVINGQILEENYKNVSLQYDEQPPGQKLDPSRLQPLDMETKKSLWRSIG